MDATLRSLGDLFLQSIPTIVFFIIITLYLRSVFFRPIARILEERRKATEGVRELAQRAFEAADKKTSEFEHALQLARAEMHREHENLRRQRMEEQEKAIEEARAQADRQIEAAKQEIAREVARAQQQMDAEVENLSDRIVDSLLKRRAA